MKTENKFSDNPEQPLLRIGPDFTVHAFNKAASVFCASKLQKSLQRKARFPDLFDASELFTQKIEQAFEGNPQNASLQIGGTFHCFYFFPVLSENGTISQVSASISSLQKNSEAQPQLFQKAPEYDRQVYRNLFLHNPDAVYSFDLDGNFVDVNPSSALLAETTVEQLLNMNFLPLIPEEDQQNVIENFMRAKAGERVEYTTGFISAKKNYKIITVTNFPIFEENEIVGVYGIAKDVTFQKESEEKILKERKMLRAIIDNIPDYIFVKDRQHKSILSNKKFNEHILGETRELNINGLTPTDYFERSKGEEIIADNEEVMSTGKAVVNRPDIVKTIDGREEMILLTKVPLKAEKDETVGIVGIARDITETHLQNRKQELIFKIIKAFGDKPEIHEATVRTLQLFCEFLGFDYSEYYKISVDQNHLVRSAYWPLEEDLLTRDKKYGKNEGLPGMVWNSLEVQTITQKNRGEHLARMVLTGKGALKSAVGIPILYQNKLISIICLGSLRETKKIEKRYLKEIALQIAPAIENKRAQHQLNDFFKFSPNLIAVIGVDGYFKSINPYFEHKFGFSEKEILNHRIFEFIHPDDLEMSKQALSDLSVENKSFEIRCRKKNGDYLWVSWRFSEFFQEDNVIFIYGTDITPVIKAQEQLKLSEEKYRSLFDASPLPMWVLDRSSLRFLSVNKAAINLYGYTSEEFLQMSVRDLWAPNQEKEIEKVVANNYNEFFRLKVRHRRKDGSIISVIAKSNPVVFNGINARVSLINNITERLEAQEKLRRSELRFKALVQEGSDLISILDCNYTYKYNSPAVQAVFGLSAEEINGTHFIDYVHKDDLEQVQNQLKKLKTEKRLQLSSYRIRNEAGEWRWIETIVTNLKQDPSVNGIIMNSRDITEFVKQERQILDSLERYNIVAKATSDLITDYDVQNDEMKVSKLATKMLGYSEDEIGKKGSWWNERIHPEDYKKVKPLIKEMRRNGTKNLTIEYRFRCADGTYKHILDRSYLIADKDGKPKRIIASMQDITEQKQYLIAIQEHNERLREIAWTQSHVVRAPLAKVMGLVDLLKNYKNDIENIDEILENILTSACELDKIIRKIAVKTEKEL